MKLLIPIAHAGAGPPLIPPNLPTNLGTCDFTTGELHFYCIPLYVAHLIEFFFFSLGFFCILQVMFAGFQIASANLLGNDKEAGFGRLRWALIGLTIAILAYVIIDFFFNGIASRVT